MTPRPRPLVACVVLNTNRRDDTLECLASIVAGTYDHVVMIVVDCLSTDGSVDAVNAAFPAARVIRLERNGGYAGNNNVGIRAALQSGAEWVFLLNEDTVLAPDCLRELVAAGEHDDRIGIVGPLVYHHDEPDVIQSAGGGLTKRWRGFHFSENERDTSSPTAPHDVQWISGCAIMVRREVIEEIGGIDERFFIYWEETEWCIRAAAAGWRVVNVPRAKTWHKGVQRNYRPKPHATYYLTRNRFLLLATRQAPVTAWLAAWVDTVRTLASWTLKPRWCGMRAHRNAMWQGACDFVRGHTGPMPNMAEPRVPIARPGRSTLQRGRQP